jgi:hypothetical protein
MLRTGILREPEYALPFMTGIKSKWHGNRRFVTRHAGHVLRSASSNLLRCSVSKAKIRRSNVIRIQ